MTGRRRRPASRAGGARDIARRVLARVDKGAFASLALGGELGRADLSPTDRRLATEIVYGVLRTRTRLDRALSAHAKKGIKRLPPGVTSALRIGAYQILFLDRVPAHAAVDDAVTATRRVAGARLAGVANGVLRGLSREGEPPLPDPKLEPRAYAEAACSLPSWIAGRLEEAVGRAELAEAAAALAESAPLCARENAVKAEPGAVRRALEAEGATAEPVPACPRALAVRGLGDPESSPSFAAGLWTVQDAGAQLVSHLLAPREGARILDACAGVGGKTTHLAELAGCRVTVDAADSSPVKLAHLEDTAARLGVAARVVPRRLELGAADADLGDGYDAILLDAPCTGLGVMRRHPETKWRVSEAQVTAMAAVQDRLLRDVAGRLASGGVLVYSVCTFTREEGPERIAALLRDRPDFTLEAPPARPGGPDWSALLAADGSLKTWPHRHGADAFYAARLRRRGET